MRAPLHTFLFALLGGVAGLSHATTAEWLPVTPEELQLTAVPQAPGAPAVILYRQLDRSDYGGFEDNYVRIKILTEDGRKYGDVEIPFYKDRFSVRDIQARTIRPDGNVVPFAGTIYEKQLAGAQAGTLLAKTFQLPDITPGCIVEFRYRVSWQNVGYFGRTGAYNSQWILSENLFTRTAKFSLLPERTLSLRFSWPNGLPAGTAPPDFDHDHDRVVMEAHDVPAFVVEDHMPPENQLKLRVDFIYSNDWHFETDPAIYWKKFGVLAFKYARNFVDERAAMERSVAQIVQPGDSPEEKLRKIYARVQRLRNLSYLPSQSAQELQRQQQAPRNVAEVWERGAGNERDINWLLLALVRAAGMSADPVLLATRYNDVFDPRTMNSRQLIGSAVLVNLGGSNLYLEPGVPFVPYGLLPWGETDVRGLRLDESGGTWVTTPLPDSSKSRVERNATLSLSEGNLQGQLTVSFTGIEAHWRRLDERNEDDAARRQFLEKQVEAALASGIDVKLTNSPDWSSAETPLVAQFELRVPGWATGAGRRELLPIGLFGAGVRQGFQHATRVHPVYFGYPHELHDELAIALPTGWHLESLPPGSAEDLKVLRYRITASGDTRSLKVTRDLDINLYEAKAASYPAIQGFFEKVRVGDEQQAVVAPEAKSAR